MTTARIGYINLFARDIERLCTFYAGLFGFAEIAAHRSPIYRCLEAGGIELGFNADKAYELLGLSDRKAEGRAPVTAYLTIEVATPADVDDAAARVETAGGKIIKPPYDTYYNARQTVLEDPEGNVFRVNHRYGPRLPADQVAQPPWQGR